MNGIVYKNGEPDFSRVSESTVKIGYMNTERNSRNVRYGPDSSRTTVYMSVTGKNIHTKADPDSMADLQMKYEKPGNFQQADILTAKKHFLTE